jgi:dihydroneopterin aldolase
MSAHLTEQRVFVRGLVVQAEIGLNPDERGRRQPVRIDATLTLLPRPPEHLRDTFNYEHVVTAARALADGGHIELVETFALRLAEACLAHPVVQTATIAVGKPEALTDAELAGAEVVLTRALLP